MSSLKNNMMRTILILFATTIILPTVVMFIWSFTNNYVWPQFVPDNLGTRGWEYLFKNSDRVLMSLKNSIFLSLMTTILTIVVSLPCANALAFDEFKFKNVVEMFVYSPVVVPMVSIAMGLNVQFIEMGLARTYTGLIIVCMFPCIPYAVNILREVYMIVGNKYEIQASLLGANKMKIFFNIQLPMIMPGIISSAIMCYIISFSQYFLVFLIGGGKIVTFTMDMFPFLQSGDRMMGSVYGVIFTVSMLVLLVIMEWLLKSAYKKELEDYMYV